MWPDTFPDIEIVELRQLCHLQFTKAAIMAYKKPKNSNYGFKIPAGILFELPTTKLKIKKLKQIDMTLVKVNNPINRTFDGLMSELFNELPVSFGKSIREDVLHFPPANIIEKAEAYQVELAAPGFDKADFNVKLDGKILNISAEKKTEAAKENEKMIRKEFGYRSFKRSFTLDEKIDATNITAKYENGILKLELPKKEELKNAPKEIAIQ